MISFREIVNSLLFLIHGTILFAALITNIPQKSYAQEALGIVNSNYTGVNSLWINPANAANSRNAVSLNLLAGDGFVNSNYFLSIKRIMDF